MGSPTKPRYPSDRCCALVYGACGATVETWVHLELATAGLVIRVELPGTWRGRNASAAQGPDGWLLPGPAFVPLCSDACERRYGEVIGFWEDTKDPGERNG